MYEIDDIVNKVYCCDCLEFMKALPDGSVDLILQDPPYNTTACKWEWDIMTKIEEFWTQWKRIIKPNGAIVMTASQPFTSKLVMSNLKWFSHQWIWKKNRNGNSLLVNTAPLKNFEEVLVFIQNQEDRYNNNPIRQELRKIARKYGENFIVGLFEKEGRYTSGLSARVHASYKFGFSGGNRFDLMDKKMFDYLSEFIDFGFEYEYLGRNENRLNASIKRIYNPQGVQEINREKTVGKKPTHIGARLNQEGNKYIQKYTKYPTAIIEFDVENRLEHPTQKPVALFEYLIRTYTNEGDTVYDGFLGSGTTAVAAIRTGRRFIGIEISPEYCAIANKRIQAELAQLKLDL